jgi:hypothetical protein
MIDHMNQMSVKILFNDCYGGFEFSNAFEEEYRARGGSMTNGRMFRIGPESIRCDPLAIAIFEEKGSEWCSGPNSMLEIREIPAIFERYWEVDEYDGNESIRVCVSEAYADILHTFMDTGDKASLDRQYAALKAASG